MRANKSFTPSSIVDIVRLLTSAIDTSSTFPAIRLHPNFQLNRILENKQAVGIRAHDNWSFKKRREREMSAVSPQLVRPIDLNSSLVICGRIPAILSDWIRDARIEATFCADIFQSLKAGEQQSPAVVVIDEMQIQTIELGVLRITLALMRQVHVLVHGSSLCQARRKELLQVGIAGFLEEGASPEAFRIAIQRVAEGQIWANRQLLSAALRGMISVVDDPRFTRRETEILRCVAAGDDNRHIAEKLYISRETVRWHLRSAYAKLGIHDRHACAGLMQNTVSIRR